MAINYELRIFTAKTYLEKLEIGFKKGWSLLYKEYLDNKLDNLEKLTLLHPDFIKGLHLPDYILRETLIFNIQGKRKFDSENGACQSNVIWGYDCHYNSSLCNGDHLFPYSLGGPTIGANKLLLCHYHNMVKGPDIHLFPWDDTQNKLNWVDSQIRKTYNTIGIYL